MSGGHFDYVCFKATNAADAINALDDLKRMERELREVGKHDVADEIYRFTLEIETCKRHIEINGKRLENLLQTVEWAFSADYSMDEIDDAYGNLIGKRPTA